MKVFFDTEFTGLRQNTTLISLGTCDHCNDADTCEWAWMVDNLEGECILEK
ncbi:MAG: hypothetical protein PHY29_11485 [Syntrophales bacterium]|nr:hypothetical protein [Syntrophales bacterium]